MLYEAASFVLWFQRKSIMWKNFHSFWFEVTCLVHLTSKCVSLQTIPSVTSSFIAITTLKPVCSYSIDMVPARSNLQLLLPVSVLRSNPSRQQQLRCEGSDDHPADGSQPGHDGVSDEGLRMIRVQHAERSWDHEVEWKVEQKVAAMQSHSKHAADQGTGCKSW